MRLIVEKASFHRRDLIHTKIKGRYWRHVEAVKIVEITPYIAYSTMHLSEYCSVWCLINSILRTSGTQKVASQWVSGGSSTVDLQPGFQGLDRAMPQLLAYLPQ